MIFSGNSSKVSYVLPGFIMVYLSQILQEFLKKFAPQFFGIDFLKKKSLQSLLEFFSDILHIFETVFTEIPYEFPKFQLEFFQGFLW